MGVQNLGDRPVGLVAAPRRVGLALEHPVEGLEGTLPVAQLAQTLADRNVLAGVVSISEPGVYSVEWTVLGIDGHEITGSFSFGYATDEEIPEAEDGHGHESPDTALHEPARAPLVPIGLGLLAAAVLLAVRRFAVR